MTLFARLTTGVLTFGILAAGRPALAEPIPITEGTLTGRLFATIELASPQRSFELLGQGDFIGGRFDPTHCLPCTPGSQQSLGATWGGLDFRGEATIEGTTYRFTGADRAASALVEFTGSWVAPAFAGVTSTSVTNPFLFTGRFIYPADAARSFEQLFGSGFATVNLNWLDSVQAWNFAGATYTFSPEPVPEPASIFLTGAGLAILGRRLRRRRPSP